MIKRKSRRGDNNALFFLHIHILLENYHSFGILETNTRKIHKLCQSAEYLNGTRFSLETAYTNLYL